MFANFKAEAGFGYYLLVVGYWFLVDRQAE